MRIPGKKRSSAPDECGFRAGRFAEAVRDSLMSTAWDMLSRESQGVRQGVWATQGKVDLQVVYRAAHDQKHPMFQLMMEDLTDLGVAPTSYIDDRHAFAFLPFGIKDDQEVMRKGGLVPGIIIPMLLEDAEWRVDLPGWHLAW